uniref:NADH-ubiquinone oxidoreductase chain 5 n=1 Tax=Pristaulacus compressus TaxID=1414807 RepID=U5TUN3_9HYME|nr:NADH dehydrogenase subunit 5 [Pristaulacus compressus]AGZ13118.1 NADH dehydrogenase subunit 5 [Pristaulacus compressus]
MKLSIIFFMSSMMFLEIMFFSFLISVYLLKKKLNFLIYWMLYFFNSMEIKYLILIDWMCMLFISVISLISSMILVYSIEYMEGDKFLKRFFFLKILFIISMYLLILSPSLISILLGWDGLGLISFCLVIYYQNLKSYIAGMLTILLNRVGDIMLLMSIGMITLIGSFNLMNYIINNFMLLLLLIIAGMTKSAQIPFSSWLPAAMAAPTPISAMVHSSTLVTAGIYMLIRFNKLFEMSYKLKEILMCLMVLTMIMASMSASMENDLKKIIALSTLSQLSLMLVSLFLINEILAFFHLLTHALFKSMLFMCSGYIIHYMKNFQDIRYLGSMIYLSPIMVMSFSVSNYSLSGIYFLTGFYSKDLIIEYVMNLKMNLLIMISAYFTGMFSLIYSFRLMFYCMVSQWNFMKLSSSLIEFKLMNISLMFMMVMTVFGGVFLSWNYFNYINILVLSMKIKVIMILMLIFGMIFSMMFWKINLFSSMKKKMFLVYFLMDLWMLKNLLTNNNKVIYFSSMNYYFKVEKGWNEFFGVKLLNKFSSEIIKWWNKKVKNLMLILFMNFFFTLLLVIVMI